MTDLLRDNLSCLPDSLASAIGNAAAGSSRRFCTTRSRSGHTVTGEVIDGRERFFHSVYDPIREAERLSDGLTADTAIVVGFGTGLHLGSLLRRCNCLIVVDPDLEPIAHALRSINLVRELSDPNLRLMLGPGAENLRQQLPEMYRPAVGGSAQTVELPGRVQAHPELWNGVRHELRVALEMIADDFAVQARFGHLWMRNTIANLAWYLRTGVAEDDGPGYPAEYPQMGGRDVVVTAAGPSLFGHLGALADRGNRFLLATDTSLPTLLASGICPDAVLTVDCQQTSYLHYLCSGFPDSLVLADIGTPPSIFRNNKRVAPILSRHPLHGLLATIGVRFPAYDSSGGNVTHAAVALACSLGASSVAVLGADFSYPLGESYARGSYVHHHFAVRASRTRPVSTAFYRFARTNPGVYHDPDVRSTLRLPLMDRYRDAFGMLADSAETPITTDANSDQAGPPHGELVAVGAARRPSSGQIAGPPDSPSHLVPPDVLSRLTTLFTEIRNLGDDALLGDRCSGSSIDVRTLAAATALLPYLAWQRRNSPDVKGPDLVRLAVRNAVDLLSHFSKVQPSGRE